MAARICLLLALTTFAAGFCGVRTAGAADAPLQAQARWVWGGVAAFPEAVVKNAAAAAVRFGQTVGGKARDAIFLHPRPRGRARLDFPPIRASAGQPERLFFLAWAGIHDPARLDDPEHPADGVRFYVLVDGRERARAAAKTHAWIPLTADLGPIPPGKARSVSVTLADDSGGHGNPNYDWALFGNPMLVAVPDSPLPNGRPVHGTSGFLAAEFPAGAAGAGLVVDPLDQAGRGLPGGRRLEGPGVAALRFDFSAVPGCVAWRWRPLGAGAAPKVWGGSWPPAPEIAAAGPARGVFFAGEPLEVRIRIRNRGRGALLPGDHLAVACAGTVRPVSRLGPGAKETLSFPLPARPAGPVRLSWKMSWAGHPAETGPVSIFEVWPRPPVLSKDRPDGPAMRHLPGAGGWLLLEDARSRWLFNLRVPGMGTLFWCWANGEWQPVGSAAPLAELALPDGACPPLEFSPPAPLRNRVGFRTEARVKTGPAAGLRLRAEFTLARKAPALSVVISARAQRPVRLGALRGPAVLAGDRCSGVRKGIALFPGLEYLEGPESSSSPRDLAPPFNLRTVPDPYKICVPMMLVETRPAGPAAAVLWDPKQKWDGVHARPAAAFASPNFLRGQDNHFMQLFLPSVPDYVPENRFLAAGETPYVLTPAHPLRLALFIAAGVPAPDVSGAFSWFDSLVGFPPPEPPPRKFPAEMALCRHGFLHTVWDSVHGHSRHIVGGPAGNAPSHATLLLVDARAAAKGRVRRELLERVAVIAHNTVREEGVSALSSPRNCHILAGEFPYHYGMLPEALGDLRRRALHALATQANDGGWGYTPDARRRPLGRPGTRVSGIIARNTLALARWTAISGAPNCEAGLRRALRCLGRFQIPRGAQGWECPIHEPDVLAAAYAVRACVWAYMALGDSALLDQARFWARTGLAFQYAWDDGRRPGMRYASIPVFGSTFFHHSWLGLPVQWCGLVYAYSLQELARFDRNPWWPLEAAGILHSAMFQQWPLDAPKTAGTYPDSFGRRFSFRNPPYINPEDIEVNLLALHGFDPGLRARRLDMGRGRRLQATAPCRFRAETKNGTVSLRLHYFPGQVVYCTLAPAAAPPAGVESGGNGAPFPRRKSLGPGETGWAYDPETRLLAAGVRCDARGSARVVFRGLRPAAPPQHGRRGTP